MFAREKRPQERNSSTRSAGTNEEWLAHSCCVWSVCMSPFACLFDQPMRAKVNGDCIWMYSSGRGCWGIGNGELVFVHRRPEVTIVVIIKIIHAKAIGGKCRFRLKIGHRSRFLDPASACSPGKQVGSRCARHCRIQNPG